MFTITSFVLMILIFIFVMIDFSENSDDFTDRGATFIEIIRDYYLNYIPEMLRLVSPVAVFAACLFLTGQLSERLEITALKAAGVSLYRMLIPFVVFAVCAAITLSVLDAYIIPTSNKDRIAFEEEYIKQKNEQIDRNRIYREISENSILSINYFDDRQNTAYQVRLVEFDSLTIKKTIVATNMSWKPNPKSWQMISVTERVYTDSGYVETRSSSLDTTLSVMPQDLSRSTSDVYQLTYPEARNYIQSIERSGAGGVDLPKVHFYGRLAYPLSIIVVVIVGFAIASVRRRGGKGIYIAAGLTVSYLYLAFMKIIEPFGAHGSISPELAATIPHVFFFFIGLVLLLTARK
jgi:lipopolysaccharide export system permease protein